MTDNTSDIAGDYPGGLRITCILNEGAPTVSATSYDEMGRSAKGLTWASELEEGDIVAIDNSSNCTYAACGGIPCVERPVTGETLVIGQIVSVPKLQTFPATSGVADTLSERLAGDYYRTAVVEIWGGITKVIDAVVMDDGSNAIVPGVSSYLYYNITSGYSDTGQKLQFETTTGSGVGVIPFHYVAAGTDADLSTILVGITGLMTADTGA